MFSKALKDLTIYKILIIFIRFTRSVSDRIADLFSNFSKKLSYLNL